MDTAVISPTFEELENSLTYGSGLGQSLLIDIEFSQSSEKISGLVSGDIGQYQMKKFKFNNKEQMMWPVDADHGVCIVNMYDYW